LFTTLPKHTLVYFTLLNIYEYDTFEKVLREL